MQKEQEKPNSSLLAGTQMFCFGEYLMYKGTSTYHINSCETIEMFYKIRTDLDKLKYAIHVDKIIMDVTEENENCYNILQLLLNTLYTISETEKDFRFNNINIQTTTIMHIRISTQNSIMCKLQNKRRFNIF